jgi:transposase-like protein
VNREVHAPICGSPGAKLPRATRLHRAKQAGNLPEKPDGPLGVEERAELKELREEVRRLRMEREFLKKAAAWFARESQ